MKEGAPSLYVGETSRSLFERTKEHWGAWESKSDKSHILKHQLMVHKEQEPRFVMKAVKYYRSALTRQIGEAVRIRRRGGAGMILNSKSEYDRCKIPRLIVEEEEVTEEQSMEQQLREVQASIEEQATAWSNTKYKEQRDMDRGSWKQAREPKGSRTRKEHQQDEMEQNKRKKRRKYTLVEENWGEGEQTQEELQFMEGVTTPEQLPSVEEQVRTGEQPTQDSVEQTPTDAAPAPQTPPPQGDLDSSCMKRGAGRQARLTDYFVRAQTHSQPTPEAAGLLTKRIEHIEKDIGFYKMDNLKKRDIGNIGIGSNDIEREHDMADVSNNVDNKLGGEQLSNDLSIELKPAPPVVLKSNEDVICKPDDRGWCSQHKCEMKNVKVSTTKWRDRGNGRGFGNVRVKVSKFICMAKTSTHVVPQISTSEGKLLGRTLELSRSGQINTTED